MPQSLSLVPNILEKYEFDFSMLPEQLKCVLCQGILKNAQQTLCGCKMCYNCIKSYLSRGPKACPSKQSYCANVILNINEGIYQDKAINKEIRKLVVKCPFYSCPYSCALENMADHIDSCEFREIICENCGIKFHVKEKNNHINKCDKSDLTTIHPILMRGSKVLDNNNLSSGRVNLIKHFKISQNKKFECPFHQLDCKIYKMTKENLMNHLEKSHLDHTSFLRKKNTDLETKSLKDVILMKEKSYKTNMELRESRLKVEKLEESIKKASDLIRINTVDNYRNEIFRNSSFIWKFTDFEVKRVDAESGGRVLIISDSFYTSESGYKMCFHVYPGGIAIGKGTHLSVFFAIMKGEFDDLLLWPFRNKVTLSILDQERGSKHHSATFQPDVTLPSYQKPTGKCNTAIGFRKFISLSLIMNNNSIYCKNDTIFLKIEVDTMGIYSK